MYQQLLYVVSLPPGRVARNCVLDVLVFIKLTIYLALVLWAKRSLGWVWLRRLCTEQIFWTYSTMCSQVQEVVCDIIRISKMLDLPRISCSFSIEFGEQSVSGNRTATSKRRHEIWQRSMISRIKQNLGPSDIAVKAKKLIIFKSFYWSIVDTPSCISFKCTT